MDAAPAALSTASIDGAAAAAAAAKKAGAAPAATPTSGGVNWGLVLALVGLAAAAGWALVYTAQGQQVVAAGLQLVDVLKEKVRVLFVCVWGGGAHRAPEGERRSWLRQAGQAGTRARAHIVNNAQPRRLTRV